MKDICANCRFYREPHCRANPPLGHADIVPEQNTLTGKVEAKPITFGYWPIVRADQWCGKHEPKPSPETH